jgi:alkylhydroperoxidase family enzyme
MRLREVERGDSLASRLLIGFISMASRMRLPDAARVAFYHRAFGSPLGAWTQAAMRGPSTWTIGERELMAAMVAKWNSCTFCLGAHRAIAAKQLPTAAVDGTLAEFRAAPISNGLKATLGFLEKMTLRPRDLTPEDARTVLRARVTPEALTDAIAVASLFNIITRYADALDFAIPTADEFDRAGEMLLKRGYGSR